MINSSENTVTEASVAEKRQNVEFIGHNENGGLVFFWSWVAKRWARGASRRLRWRVLLPRIGGRLLYRSVRGGKIQTDAGPKSSEPLPALPILSPDGAS